MAIYWYAPPFSTHVLRSGIVVHMPYEYFHMSLAYEIALSVLHSAVITSAVMDRHLSVREVCYNWIVDMNNMMGGKEYLYGFNLPT